MDSMAINGSASIRKGSKSKSRKLHVSASQVNSARRYITISLGCGIPLLSLSLSNLGGNWLQADSLGLNIVGGATLALCCAVLGVSLSHLAWAIEDITRSARWQSWALAVTLDMSIVVLELSGVCGYSGFLCNMVMVAVTVASMALNCWAFLGHGSKKGK